LRPDRGDQGTAFCVRLRIIHRQSVDDEILLTNSEHPRMAFAVIQAGEAEESNRRQHIQDCQNFVQCSHKAFLGTFPGGLTLRSRMLQDRTPVADAPGSLDGSWSAMKSALYDCYRSIQRCQAKSGTTA